MYVRESGPRDQATRGCIVFVHGFPFDGSMWAPQLHSLPEGWRGLAPDLPGFGKSPLDGQQRPSKASAGRLQGSGIARDDEPVLSMARLAGEIAELIDRECDGFAVVCGLSMGGYVSFELLRRHAGKIRGLILVDTRAEADSDEARENRLLMAQTARDSGTGPIATAMIPDLLAGSTRQTRPEIVARVRSMILAVPAATVVGALAGMAARRDSTGDLATIGVPTLVVVGDQDAITPPDGARRMAEAVPGATLEIIPDAGHVSNLENPDAFNRAMSGFLNSL